MSSVPNSYLRNAWSREGSLKSEEAVRPTYRDRLLEQYSEKVPDMRGLLSIPLILLLLSLLSLFDLVEWVPSSSGFETWNSFGNLMRRNSLNSNNASLNWAFFCLSSWNRRSISITRTWYSFIKCWLWRARSNSSSLDAFSRSSSLSFREAFISRKDSSPPCASGPFCVVCSPSPLHTGDPKSSITLCWRLRPKSRWSWFLQRQDLSLRPGLGVLVLLEQQSVWIFFC